MSSLAPSDCEGAGERDSCRDEWPVDAPDLRNERVAHGASDEGVILNVQLLCEHLRVRAHAGCARPSMVTNRMRRSVRAALHHGAHAISIAPRSSREKEREGRSFRRRCAREQSAPVGSHLALTLGNAVLLLAHRVEFGAGRVIAVLRIHKNAAAESDSASDKPLSAAARAREDSPWLQRSSSSPSPRARACLMRRWPVKIEAWPNGEVWAGLDRIRLY